MQRGEGRCVRSDNVDILVEVVHSLIGVPQLVAGYRVAAALVYSAGAKAGYPAAAHIDTVLVDIDIAHLDAFKLGIVHDVE